MSAGIAVEHGLDPRVVLVGRRAQVRAVLEVATRLGVLDGERDGVVVGVEVPREAVAFLRQVDDDVGQRVGVREERVLAERSWTNGANAGQP